MKRSELFCLCVCVCERDTVCVGGEGGGRRVHAAVCTLLLLSIFLVSEPFLFPCFIESLCFIVKCIECFM